MPQVKVSTGLTDLYADYYKDGESAWRRVCALDKAANIVRLARDVPHASVLEIGAGEGAILARLSELQFASRLAALEISPSGVAVIKARAIPELQSCEVFDGYAIPNPDDAFDLAVLSHVVEHVEHPRILLREARRVARHVFVEVPVEDTLRLPANWRDDGIGHINHYSPRTIRYLLQTCGLRVLRQETTIPSLAVHRFHGERLAACHYLVKRLLLHAMPQTATRYFTYHCALLGETAQDCDKKTRA